MRFGKTKMRSLSLFLLWGCLGCQSVDTRSSGLKEAEINDLEISEEDANLAIESTIERDPGSFVNSGDEADFLDSNRGKENFANEASQKTVKENMFGDEANNEALADQPNPDFPMDPTALSEELGQESMANDPTALTSTDEFASNVLPTDEGDPIADAAAAESAAMISNGLPPGDAVSDIDPVGIGSEQVPPDFIEQSAPVTPPAMANSASTAAPVMADNQAPANPEEIEPAASLLSWVGYRIAEKERQLKVEIYSQGNPDFEVFEETNRAQQLEVVLRFYQTRLRRKIHWDINSSEFRSPVAYVRMREYKDKGVVDVVLTHRDAILPQFYARDGRILLIYPIPEQYFNSSEAQVRVVKEKAISLVAGNEAPLRQVPKISPGGPLKIGHARGTLFREEPTALRPIKEILRSSREDELDDKGLPEDFDRKNRSRQQRAAYHIEVFSLSSVGQDDLDSAAEVEEIEEEEEEETSNAMSSLQNRKKKQNEAESREEPTNAVIQNVPTETENAEAAPLPASEEFQPSNSIDAQSTVPMEALETNALPPDPIPFPAPAPDPVSDISITDEALADPPPALPPPQAAPPPADMGQSSPMTSPIEMTGQSNPNAGQQYVGRPIFMEFYDAPLSLILKSFSEETGNNFVYSSAVGGTPVTVHFKGVPWDEALKAILETYSLGMVRIGENVVRVDQVTRLTQYMQDLEQAKQFEIRRVPTKVLVFRLNNAVSRDVAARLIALLSRDVELDPRTKIQADDRTNSIVMEASTLVLNKAKAIIERLDLETPQVEIASRIVEVQKTMNNFFGLAWGNSFNFDPGRALGFGSLNFPNSVGSSFAVDPGVNAANTAGVGRFRFGSLNKFVDLDLLLRMEEKKGTTNVLQSNRVLVLDGQKASILAGNSRFFRPAAGAAGQVPGQPPAGGGGNTQGEAVGLAEVKFNLQLDVKPQITALGAVIMDLLIKSDTPGDSTGEALASKNTRELTTQMVRDSGDTGVIGGIYDTSRTSTTTGVPFLSDIPILGALFRTSQTVENQTELLIMVTPTIVSGRSTSDEAAETAAIKSSGIPAISIKNSGGTVKQAL